jgi:hypothetical protein
MKSFRAIAVAVTMLVVVLVSPAQAMSVAWNFGWQKDVGPTQYKGEGSFSYDASAVADGLVTHGKQPAFFIFPEVDVPDDLLSFNLEGFIDGVSVGSTNALPKFFSFSPLIGNGFVLAMDANTDGSNGDAGIGCLFQICSLFIDGENIKESAGLVFTERTGSVSMSLPEPGTLGLMSLGLFFSGLIGRRRETK